MEEIQKIEELLEASKTISDIYDNLYELEISEKSDSEEYYKLISMLKNAIKIEKTKYQETNFDFKKNKSVFRFLHSSQGVSKLGNIDSILYQKYDDRAVRRTLSILSGKIILNINFQKEIAEESLSRIFSFLGENIPKEIYKEMNNNAKVKDAINNDIMLIFLTILEEYISSKKYSNIKNELIKLKYYISLINLEIESQLLECNFKPANATYTNSRMIAGLLQVNAQEYDLLKEGESRQAIAKHISDLLNIKDNEYEIKEKNIESIIRQCFIRALLTLVNDDTVYKLNSYFHDFVDSPEYLKQHPNDRISEAAIITCFKSLKYDRAKTRSLSFQLPPMPKQ